MAIVDYLTDYFPSLTTSAAIAKTADETLTSGDVGETFTNNGATGTVTLTLPAAVAGDTFLFIREGSHLFRIKPATGEEIGEGGADKYIEMQKNGSKITLRCYSNGTWVLETETGLNDFEP